MSMAMMNCAQLRDKLKSLGFKGGVSKLTKPMLLEHIAKLQCEEVVVEEKEEVIEDDKEDDLKQTESEEDREIEENNRYKNNIDYWKRKEEYLLKKLEYVRSRIKGYSKYEDKGNKLVRKRK